MSLSERIICLLSFLFRVVYTKIFLCMQIKLVVIVWCVACASFSFVAIYLVTFYSFNVLSFSFSFFLDATMSVFSFLRCFLLVKTMVGTCSILAGNYVIDAVCKVEKEASD